MGFLPFLAALAPSVLGYFTGKDQEGKQKFEHQKLVEELFQEAVRKHYQEMGQLAARNPGVPLDVLNKYYPPPTRAQIEQQLAMSGHGDGSVPGLGSKLLNGVFGAMPALAGGQKPAGKPDVLPAPTNTPFGSPPGVPTLPTPTNTPVGAPPAVGSGVGVGASSVGGSANAPAAASGPDMMATNNIVLPTYDDKTGEWKYPDEES